MKHVFFSPRGQHAEVLKKVGGVGSFFGGAGGLQRPQSEREGAGWQRWVRKYHNSPNVTPEVQVEASAHQRPSLGPKETRQSSAAHQ